eukprot:gene1949-1413_t
MNEKGVDVHVLSTVPGTGFNYHVPAADALEVARFLNDHLYDTIQQYPTRLVGLGTVPMQDTEMAIAELRRCMNDLKFIGIQIGSHINGKNLESPDLEPFWAEVEALNLMGTDYPFPLGEIDRPGGLIEDAFKDDEEVRKRLLWKNALEFLGLPSDDARLN